MSALIRITIVVPDPVAGCLPAALRAPTASAGPAGTVPPDDDAPLSTTSAMGNGTALRRWGPAVAELGLAMAEDFVPGLGVALAVGKVVRLALATPAADPGPDHAGSGLVSDGGQPAGEPAPGAEPPVRLTVAGSARPRTPLEGCAA